MKPRLIAATLGTAAITIGGVDAATLREQPMEIVAQVAQERIEVRQEENVVATTLPWKDQPGLTVKYDLGEPTLMERLADRRRKEVITEVVPFADSQGFKVDVLLYERPATNCFSYQLEGWEAFDFFLQPALTQEEIDQGMFRPEEIVGSYAVYHKTLRDHVLGQENYATGKFAHIPYPYVWEFNNEEGTKHRAESFTIENGLMTVCVKPEFLDNATYPVRVDPTFGYTTMGASLSPLLEDYGAGERYATYVSTRATGANGTLDNITAAISANSADTLSFKGVLYERNGASGPHSRTAVSSGQSFSISTTTAWHTIVAGGEVITGTEYFVGVIGSHVDLNIFNVSNIAFDSAGATDFSLLFSVGFGIGGTPSAVDALFYNAPLNPLSASEFSNNLYSVYATYTVAAPSTTPPNATLRGTGGLQMSGGIIMQ